jgi:hypothetical protein
MINENMKKVLVALRSGEYNQSKLNLQNISGYCCLGVMCEVYEKETGNTLDRDTLGIIKGSDLRDQEHVQNWVGLRTFIGEVFLDTNELNAQDLTMMNDHSNKTFLEIADFIESEPEGLLL